MAASRPRAPVGTAALTVATETELFEVELAPEPLTPLAALLPEAPDD
jgi:hypothetical protein